MEQIIVNIGSSSKKYALYKGNEKLIVWHFEKVGQEFKLAVTDGGRIEVMITSEEFQHAIDRVIADCTARGIATIGAIAVRTVAPGDYFAEHRVVDDEFMEKFEAQEYLAPLHIHPARLELALIRAALPNTRLISASDSAFHHTMPNVAKSYGLSAKVVDEFGFARYGYHGHSVASIWDRLNEHASEVAITRTIVLHLGSGASITALRDGKTIDTSMGFTPLEGLMMGTRSGTIDPSIIFALLSAGKTRAEIETLCNKESGLLGLSGVSSDMRDIIRLSGEGDEKAKLALDLFVYQVVKTVGSYIAVLGGLDALVFTAAIGEGAPVVRNRIIESLSAFGLALNPALNAQLVGTPGEAAFLDISADNSSARILVVQTNESASILKALREHLD
ncbi:MAG TPA: acetate/propionate family kinase [Candidatus Paceibacterota bacterium]|nr:acetate/propionate family kinase [Candidatus Paceibacterota bacterium]